jgi:opacity protein-like surface antigen
MKRLLVVFIVILVVFNLSFAADAKTKAGDRALLFSFSGLGTFGMKGYPVADVMMATGGQMQLDIPFLGSITLPAQYLAGLRMPQHLTGIGMKYYMKDDFALRGAFNFHYDKADLQSYSYTQTILVGTPPYQYPQTITTTIDSAEVKNLFFGLNPGFEYHFANSGAVTAYIGGEAMFAMAKSTTTFRGKDVSGKGTIFGVGAILGAEFFPWDNIAMSAEYKLGFSTNSTSTDYPDGTSVNGPTYTSFGTNSWGVGLAVYF